MKIKCNIGVSRQGIVAALKRHVIVAFVILNAQQTWQILSKKEFVDVVFTVQLTILCRDHEGFLSDGRDEQRR